ncbi:efflux RND transporter permease subunit [Rheinheimera sp. 4Y26]|uniref:efflux RND transporter permease subunit n=1 Tax=Rheinheimera sp. 4Y26 TaxID=2977811 RepID=UPI0021B0998F|nr:efflux RND transporter permease subunit [Rheinheimera sp. 4Y26]MCT6698622.1 efflux RND transporter permease subunit [Rheinheimera sp. 4Y26]
MSSSAKRSTDIFVSRPILAIVFSLLICFGGLWAAKEIAVLQFPRLESTALEISTRYTGAAAATVKGFITDPVERVAATIPGLDYVDSVSKAGESKVTVYLRLNEDSTRALAELNSKLSQIRYQLPAGAEDPLVNVKRADRPHALFYLNVSAAGIPLSQLTDYLSRQVTPVLGNIPGVQKVDIEGRRTPAMRVTLDADSLSAFNLSPDDVWQALAANNSIATLGFTETSKQRIDLVANTQLATAEDFASLIVRQAEGQTVYLRDLATVALAHEEAVMTARLDQQDTVYLSVWPLPGANEIAVGDALYAATAALNPTLPDGVEIQYAYDGTLYMRDALKEIFITLAETILLVALVVLLMMGSLRTAAVPLVTIPVSILGAIAAISLAGFSLNLLTVLAIVLSVGLVVDDAIVVVENVARLVRQGHSRYQAALLSARQLFTPIVAMTLTLAAVYAPIGLLSGLSGVLFREFAFTLAIAVIISGVVAVTLSPVMSSWVIADAGRESRFSQRVNHSFGRFSHLYRRALLWAQRFRLQLLSSALLLSLLLLPFYQGSQKELAPVEDQSSIYVLVQSPPESSLLYNEQQMRPMVDDLLKLPGATQMWQNIFINGAFGGIEFSPAKERQQSTQQLLGQVYGVLSAQPGIQPLPIMPAPLPTAGQFDVELVVKANAPYQELKEYADKLVGAAFASGHFLYADTDLKIDLPQTELRLDRDKIADLGLQIADVSQQLSVLLSGNYVNRFDAQGKAYQVIPLLSQNLRADVSRLLDLPIKTADGSLLPLSDIARLHWQTVPRQLNSFSQQNAVRIYGGVAPGSTKESALLALEAAAHQLLPASYLLDYAGESRQLRQQGTSMLQVMMLSLLVVYLLLAVQFNSFRDPLVVLFGSVPLALSAAMLLSYLDFTTLNIYSQIGLVTLVGLVAKNGILIVEFANHLQLTGLSRAQAAIEAAVSRFRPVMMTTAATVLGHFPLVLVSGAGAQARNSIGIMLVAGMLLGTLFTLFVLPLCYQLFATTRQQTAAPASEAIAADALLLSQK